MHSLVWCCWYLRGTMWREQRAGFLFPVLPASPHLFWFYNQHFSPQSRVVSQLRGAQTSNTQRPPSFSSYTHKNAEMWLFSSFTVTSCGAERPLLCTSATEIDLQAALRCYTVVQYVLFLSPRLFCSLLLPPPLSCFLCFWIHEVLWTGTH